MKKVLYIFILLFFLMTNVQAFSIDVDKINIRGKSEAIVSNLDSSYKIEANDFNNNIIYDKDINELAKTLLKISFSADTLNDKKRDIADYMFLSNTNGADTLNGLLFIETYLKTIQEENIVIERYKDIKVTKFNENDKMVFVYIQDALVNKKKKDLVVSYWLKSNDGNNFYLFFPWITMKDDLEDYFNKLINNEEEGTYIGGSYSKLAISDNSINVDETMLHNLFNQNKNSVVQITGMSDSGANTYGSGFFIREGVIVTTWSLFLQFLTDGSYIYINDVNGNTYNVLGIVAAQVDYDVVVLKISSEVGKKVILGDSSKIVAGEKLFTINSKSNSGFAIHYGENMNVHDGRIENMLPLSNGDVGSALFNINGEVVGFNVADQLYSELSYANSTDYLKKLQVNLINMEYSNIRYTLLDTFKQNYYLDIYDEEIINNVNSKTWDKFKRIGKLEKTITLDLIKASYTDKVLSLRYKNDTAGMIDSLYLVSNYTRELVKEGYKLTYQDNNKTIYSNKKYKIIIKDNLNYLIILIMEL